MWLRSRALLAQKVAIIDGSGWAVFVSMWDLFPSSHY
jgi:hypothetical protein